MELTQVLPTAVISVLTGLDAAALFKLLFDDETTFKRTCVVFAFIAGTTFTATYLLSQVLL
jgi:hypothetical protein